MVFMPCVQRIMPSILQLTVRGPIDQCTSSIAPKDYLVNHRTPMANDPYQTAPNESYSSSDTD